MKWTLCIVAMAGIAVSLFGMLPKGSSLPRNAVLAEGQPKVAKTASEVPLEIARKLNQRAWQNANYDEAHDLPDMPKWRVWYKGHDEGSRRSAELVYEKDYGEVFKFIAAGTVGRSADGSPRSLFGLPKFRNNSMLYEVLGESISQDQWEEIANIESQRLFDGLLGEEYRGCSLRVLISSASSWSRDQGLKENQGMEVQIVFPAEVPQD